MTISIGSDFQAIDFLQTVSYREKTSEGVWASAVPVPNVLQRVSVKSVTAPMMDAEECTFHVWTNQTSLVPKVNDRVKDSDGRMWIVEAVNSESLDTRFRLTCHVAARGAFGGAFSSAFSNAYDTEAA